MLSTLVSAVYTNQCSLHQSVLSTPTSAVWTSEGCLHQSVLSTPISAVYTSQCCLHQPVLSTSVTGVELNGVLAVQFAQYEKREDATAAKAKKVGVCFDHCPPTTPQFTPPPPTLLLLPHYALAA